MKEDKSSTRWLSIGCITLWGVVIYSNTLRVPFVFDDLVYIQDNPILREPLNFVRIIAFAPSRWIAFFTFALNYYVGHWTTIGYHLVNLAIHVGAAICCYNLVLMTLKTPRLKNRPVKHKSALALLAALIFLSHPVQTEAVTYVWQRVESLAALFYLLSLALYVKYRLHSEASTLLDSSSSYVLSCVFAYACAMTKETAVTLPAVIIVYEVMFFEDFSKRAGQVMLRSLPFLLLLIVVPVFAHMSPIVTKNLLYESPPAGIYVLTQTRVIATYLRLLLWPVGQNLDYDFPLSESFLEPDVMGSVLLIVLLAAIAILVRRSHPLIALGIIWFFVTLSPTSSVVSLPDVIFEHRLYLPLVGFAFVLTGIILVSGKRAKIVTAAVIAAILLLSTATYRRNTIWQNELTLWQDTVAKSPHKARPRANLAISYINIEEYDRALTELAHAISLKPDYAAAHENAGVAYFHKKAYQPAIDAFETAIELAPNQPSAYYARGEAYRYLEENDLAIKDFQKALSINPSHLSARNNLGLMLAEEGKYLKAINEFETVLRFEPNHKEASFNLARTYTLSGQVNLAIRQYEKLIDLEPRFLEAYHNLGALYLDLLNKPDEAKQCFERALAVADNAEKAAEIRKIIAQIERIRPKP